MTTTSGAINEDLVDIMTYLGFSPGAYVSHQAKMNLQLICDGILSDKHEGLFHPRLFQMAQQLSENNSVPVVAVMITSGAPGDDKVSIMATHGLHF